MSQQDTQRQQSGASVPTTKDFDKITSSSTRVEKDDLDLNHEGALAKETGSTGKSEREIAEDAIHEYLADLIYSSNKALPREYNQNAETACIRAAKLLLTHHPDYGAEWLTRDVMLDSGRVIELPRPLDEVMDAARSIGYDPTIEVSLYRDDRQLVYEDPGIGMTAHELDKAFNVTGKSGVSYDADTGGKMGVGALTFVNAAGQEGDISGWTRTRKPDAPDIDRDGIAFLTDLSGVEEIPNTVPDDFRGTRFEIPVLENDDGGFKLNKFSDWIAEYSQGLRVPLLYKEYKNGETIVEEEYGGQNLAEMYNNPPIVVDRPGEYTVVAGPNVDTGYNSPDCFLVSMPIDRNTRVSIRSLWNVVVQIHNEQGLIVKGPHRGMKQENVDSLHEDDVPLPQPTADRDRLQRDTANKRFFTHIKEVVKDEELKVAASFLDEIEGPEDVLSAPQDHPDKWTTFRKVLRKQGPRRVFTNLERFTKFIQSKDNEFRTYDEEITIKQWKNRCNMIKEHTDDKPVQDDVIGSYDIPPVYQKIQGLFNEFSHAPQDGYNVSTKSGRTEKKLGDLLADTGGSNVYMAASTGGKFKDRAKVLWNTHDNSEVVVVSGVSKYSKYGDLYGFKKLKEVPYRESDNENDEWDIPSKINDKNKLSKGTSPSSSGKADKLPEHVLKIRTDDSHSIDCRYTIEKLQEKFSKGGSGLLSRSDLVLFPRSVDRNISDNYFFADYAAIASCTNEEFEALIDCENVWTPEGFKEHSYSTVLATEDGGMTFRELKNDDRQTIIAMVDDIKGKKIITDDRETMREYFTEDLQDQVTTSDNNSDVLWAVCERKTYHRLKYAIGSSYTNRKNIFAFKYQGRFNWGLNSYRLKNSESYYQRLIDTPNWDDDSEMYKIIDSLSYNKGYKGHLKQLLLSLHDLNIDFSDMDEDEVRGTLMSVCQSTDCDDSDEEPLHERVDPSQYSWDGQK
jgi:hypothetical protein